MGVADAVQATAYLAAACRAAEATRPQPRVRDELAERFVREWPDDLPDYRGLRQAGGDEVVARTVLIDRLLLDQVATDQPPVVINLGAGFCTRPYRLDLARCAEVVEMDAAAVLAVKQRVLADRVPTCPVRRAELDLRDDGSLAALLRDCAGSRVVVVTEGLMPYLPVEAVSRLAETLAATLGSATVWLTDLVSAESAQGMAQLAGSTGASLQLYGLETLTPFESHGWRAIDYRALPVPRRAPAVRMGRAARSSSGHASHRVVDGVAVLQMKTPVVSSNSPDSV